MPEIKVTPLGAGQDVGRSCILVSIAGKNVMLDCGMHMGFNDDRRFPDFSYITQNGRLTDFLDCVIISLMFADVSEILVKLELSRQHSWKHQAEDTSLKMTNETSSKRRQDNSNFTREKT